MVPQCASFYGSEAAAPATFVGPGGTSVVVFPVGQAPRQGDNQRFTAVRRIAFGFYVIPLGVSCCPKTIILKKKNKQKQVKFELSKFALSCFCNFENFCFKKRTKTLGNGYDSRVYHLLAFLFPPSFNTFGKRKTKHIKALLMSRHQRAYGRLPTGRATPLKQG